MIETFVNAGDRGLLLEEIQRKWENKWGDAYTRRTFCNHREDIEEVFGISIECDRSSNRYYIHGDVSDSMENTAWLVNTFTVNNLLSLSKEKLRGRVSVDDVPSGHVYLTIAMDAMEGNNEVEMVYQKYGSKDPETLHVKPYALKEFERRWYLVGYCKERKDIRVYALDRVESMVISDKTFKLPVNFDVDVLFANSFGIYLPKDRKIAWISSRRMRGSLNI